MSKSFDPYREWLGIAEGQAGADYYRIFGLQPFTTDPQLIAAAADLTIARIRSLSPPAHRELHERLLEQLSTARTCLLDPPARAAYDEKLRRKRGSLPPAGAPVALAIPVEPQPDPEAVGEDVWKQVSQTARRMDYAQRRKSATSSGAKIALGSAAGLLVVVAAIGVWQFRNSEQPAASPTPVAAGPAAAAHATDVASEQSADVSAPPLKEPPVENDSPPSEPSAPSHVEPPIASTPELESAPQPSATASTSVPAASSTPTASTKPIANPGDEGAPSQAFENALQQARAALVARNVSAANRSLDLAQKAATTESQRLQVDQLRELGKQLALFLSAVRAGWQKYKATEEVSWNGNTAAIIEVSPGRVALFIEGQPRQFSVSDIPADLALFFAQAAANPDTPQALVFYGAFHTVDSRGDRNRARSLWQRAKAAEMPVELLLPLLDEPPLYERRLAVPEEAVVEAAGDKFLGQFADAILSAKTGPQRARLAKRLFETALRTKDPLEQYAALQEAREWAISGGDPVTALAACDSLGRTYAVDTLQLKSDALGASLAGTVSAAAAGKAAEAALRLSDEAEQSGRLELAGTLADTAYTAARKSRENVLIRQAHERRQALSGKR